MIYHIKFEFICFLYNKTLFVFNVVKKLLEEYFKPSKLDLGQHLNGDEAMALGASFRAANLSTAFRVRKVGMTDISAFSVSLKLETLPSKPGFFSSLFGSGSSKKEAASDGDEEWTKHTSLYPRLSQVPSKAKTVAFNYDQDILCKIVYDDDVPLPAGTSPLIAVYNITGMIL
jgi:hypoxia up-regulated 1